MKRDIFRKMYNKCVPDKTVTSRLIKAVEEADAANFAARHETDEGGDIDDFLYYKPRRKRKSSPAFYAAAAVVCVFGTAVFIAGRQADIAEISGVYESTDTAPPDMAGYDVQMPGGRDVIIQSSGDVSGEPLSAGFEEKAVEDITFGDVLSEYGHDVSGEGADVMLFSGGADMECETVTAPGMDSELIFDMLSELSDSRQKVLPVPSAAEPTVTFTVRFSRADPGLQAVFRVYQYGISVYANVDNDYSYFEFGCNSYDLFNELWDMSEKQAGNVTFGSLFDKYGHDDTGEGIEVSRRSAAGADVDRSAEATIKNTELIYTLLSHFSGCKQEGMPPKAYTDEEVVLTVRYDRENPEYKAFIHVTRNGMTVGFSNVYGEYSFPCDAFGLMNELWEMAKPDSDSVTFSRLLGKYGHDDTGEGVSITCHDRLDPGSEPRTFICRDSEKILGKLLEYDSYSDGAFRLDENTTQPYITVAVTYQDSSKYPEINTDIDGVMYIYVFRDLMGVEFKMSGNSYVFSYDCDELFFELWNMNGDGDYMVDAGKTVIGDTLDFITANAGDSVLADVRRDGVTQHYDVSFTKVMTLLESERDMTVKVENPYHNEDSDCITLDFGNDTLVSIYPDRVNFALTGDSEFSCNMYCYFLYEPMTELIVKGIGADVSMAAFENMTADEISQVITGFDIAFVDKALGGYDYSEVTREGDRWRYDYPNGRRSLIIYTDMNGSITRADISETAADTPAADISRQSLSGMTEEEIAKALTGLPFDDVNEALGGYDSELSGMYGYFYDLEGSGFLTVYLANDGTISDVLLDSAGGQTDISRQSLSKMTEAEISGLLVGMSIDDVNAMLGSFDRELSQHGGFTYDLGDKKLLTLYTDHDNSISAVCITEDPGFDRDSLWQMTDEDIRKHLLGLDFKTAEIALGGSDTDIYGNMQYSMGAFRCGYRDIFIKAEFGGSISEVTITPKFMWCVPTVKQITEGYGERHYDDIENTDFHSGIDISATDCAGAEIIAAADGTVLTASDTGDGYGIHVIIDHGGDVVTLYGHMGDWSVNVGDKVKMGQVIGHIGHSGNAYGDQCHFEVRVDGKQVDPMDYVNVPE